MIKTNDHTNTMVGKLLDEREQAEREIAANILDFYLNHYEEVYVVICNTCKTKLAIEVKDPTRPNPHHHFQRQVIEISPKFWSSRARGDGVQGYQCKCGNDTRWAKVEHRFYGHGGGRDIAPHELHAFREHLQATNYQADVKIKGKDMVIESFTIRKLK